MNSHCLRKGIIVLWSAAKCRGIYLWSGHERLRGLYRKGSIDRRISSDRPFFLFSSVPGNCCLQRETALRVSLTASLSGSSSKKGSRSLPFRPFIMDHKLRRAERSGQFREQVESRRRLWENSFTPLMIRVTGLPSSSLNAEEEILDRIIIIAKLAEQ